VLERPHHQVVDDRLGLLLPEPATQIEDAFTLIVVGARPEQRDPLLDLEELADLLDCVV
jgi:hypothetical protein